MFWNQSNRYLGRLCNILHPSSYKKHLKLFLQPIVVCVPLINSNTSLYGSVASDHFSQLPPPSIKHLRYSVFKHYHFILLNLVQNHLKALEH